MKKTYIFILVMFLLSISIQAKIKVSAHYNFGRVGNITYAIAPAELIPVKAGMRLQVKGRPVFYADAPGDKALKGEGSVLFNGNEDAYASHAAYGAVKENMILEAWIKPETHDYDDSQQGQLRTIVANGDGKEGYVIAQRGKQWVFVSGGSGVSLIGDVVKDQWVHLAAVVSEGEGTLWINGKQSASFGLTKALAPHFSIASSGKPNEAFNGKIYEVRYSTFENGQFDPSHDFLLDYKRLKKQNLQLMAERKVLIKSLEVPSLGKEMVDALPHKLQNKDWLVTAVDDACKLIVEKSVNGTDILFQLNNGLVSRTFYVSENLACVGYKNLTNDAEFIRAVKPEARINVNDTWYEVGGLKAQPENSYLLDSWYPLLEANEQAFTLEKVETGMPLKRYTWNQKYNAVATDWPAKGLRLIMTYKATALMEEVKDLEVQVNYEIYQGLPVVVKWIEISNKGSKSFDLKHIETEIIAINQDQVDRIHVESDFSFALVNGNINGSALMHFAGVPKPYHAGNTSTFWDIDKDYNTWASHNQAEDKFLGFPHHNLLISRLPIGPGVLITKEKPFKSFLTFELLQDSDDKERKSLGQRRMYKKLAPQVTESLICGGITSHDEKELKSFVDQMYELGLERLDIMAWPGISHDNMDEKYLNLWQDIASYAKERGIIMGGYELQVASRGRGKTVDCIDPETGQPGSLFGQSVCIASDWKDTYYDKMWKFFDRTGLMTYNMDGPYHGDPCASTTHKYHRGLADSQWEQWKVQVDIIHQLQARNMYIPIPDWYFLNGQSSTGMGYREASANLSPQQQLLLGRQYIYDGTWHKIPPMGWMSLQLVGFYTNDPRVGLEPLCANLDRYESQLIQFLSSGCQLTIRGKRLYDTPETKAMVAKWIDWFKEYRNILTSDIIHVSRPNGRDLDCMMHVNPFIKHKAMVIVFNPTDREIEKTIKLPLYYTGLESKANVSSEGNAPLGYSLNEKGELSLPVKIKAQATTWFVIE